jgi:hypothetical protein
MASELHGICSQVKDGLSIYVIGSPGRICYAVTNAIQENSDTRFEEDIGEKAVTRTTSSRYVQKSIDNSRVGACRSEMIHQDA